MTILIAAGGDDYAVFMSDQRLSRVTPTGYELFDDHRCKAIVWNGSIALGYTGLADVDSEPADLWISSAMFSVDPIGDLLDSANAEFGKPWARRIPARHRRTAFVGVGFDGDQPMIVRISNYHGPDRRPLPTAQTRFDLHRFTPSAPGGSVFEAIGTTDESARWDTLRRQLALRAAIGTDARDVVQSMVRAARTITRDAPEVGHNMITALIPSPTRRDPSITFATSTAYEPGRTWTAFWSNGMLSPRTEVPAITGPPATVGQMHGFVRGHENSLITFDEATSVINLTWPLWLPCFVRRRNIVVARDLLDDKTWRIRIASGWDTFPKLYAEYADSRPVVPLRIDSIDLLRTLLRDNPQITSVTLHRDDRPGTEVRCPARTLTNPTSTHVCTVPLSGIPLLRSLLRNRARHWPHV